MPSDGELARRLRELEWLHAGLRAMTETLELGTLVRTVLDGIKAVVSAEALSLLLHDAERDELVFVASETLCEETLVGRPPAAPARAPGLEERRLVVALRRGDRRLGLLELRDRWDSRPFDDADRRNLAAVADDVARALDPEAVARDEAALHAVFARVAQVVPAHTTVLALEGEAGHELVFSTSRVLRPGVVDGLRLAAGRGIAGWVARHRTTVLVDDARVDPRHDPTVARQTGLVARSMICVPVLHRDVFLGVLQVINKQSAVGFDADDVRLVEAFTAQAAAAIAHAQLYRRAELASLTDDLTGLGNTRRFNLALPAALARGGPVSLMLLDLDALKSIVDRYGHLVGSRAIATVGRLIAERLRPGDTGVRFGGDEFVAILPDTPTPTAMALAGSIRDAVAALATPDGMDVDVTALTASIGVATYPDDAGDAESLFRAADDAMYRIKFGGKNGVARA